MAANKLTLPKVNLPALDLKALADDFKTLDPKDPGLDRKSVV